MTTPRTNDRHLLTPLSLDQIADLVNDMRDWVKDCQWGEDYDDADIDAMSDEELIRGVEMHYDGGLKAFLQTCEYILI